MTDESEVETTGVGDRSIGAQSIGQIALPVQDIDRATDFYRDVIGLDFLFSAPPGLSFFRCGETRIMLTAGEGESGVGPPLLYYRTEALEAAHHAAVASGTHVEREPHVLHRTETIELWMAFYRDSENNLFAVMEERES